jgi:hypothetical protein
VQDLYRAYVRRIGVGCLQKKNGLRHLVLVLMTVNPPISKGTDQRWKCKEGTRKKKGLGSLKILHWPVQRISRAWTETNIVLVQEFSCRSRRGTWELAVLHQMCCVGSGTETRFRPENVPLERSHRLNGPGEETLAEIALLLERLSCSDAASEQTNGTFHCPLMPFSGIMNHSALLDCVAIRLS